MIQQSMTTSFKVDLLAGVQDFDTDVFKVALYSSAATLDATTTTYTTTNEVVGTNYVAGGNTLTVSVTPTSSGTTAFISFANTTWVAATITARGALIYNSSKSNKAVAVLDFGSDKTSTDGDFTVSWPTADSSNAIIRLA